MQSFLGLLNWCSKFNIELTEIIKPLYESTREKIKFVMTPELIAIFEKAKEFFVENIVLKHPQLHKDYNLYTNASYLAMGAVLTQFDDEGVERIITCINKVFVGAQLNYHTTEKELHAKI